MKNNYHSILKISYQNICTVCVNKFLLQNCIEKKEEKNFRINDSISNVLEYLDEKKKI